MSYFFKPSNAVLKIVCQDIIIKKDKKLLDSYYEILYIVRKNILYLVKKLENTFYTSIILSESSESQKPNCL